MEEGSEGGTVKGEDLIPLGHIPISFETSMFPSHPSTLRKKKTVHSSRKEKKEIEKYPIQKLIKRLNRTLMKDINE